MLSCLSVNNTQKYLKLNYFNFIIKFTENQTSKIIFHILYRHKYKLYILFKIMSVKLNFFIKLKTKNWVSVFLPYKIQWHLSLLIPITLDTYIEKYRQEHLIAIFF